MTESNQVAGKQCRDCERILPLTEFWYRKASPDGRALYCKDCFSTRSAASYDKRLERRGQRRTLAPQPRETLSPGMKRCPDCQQVLEISEFVANRTTKTGIGGYCRPCQNARARASVAKNHGSTRHYHLKRRYGIGAAEVLDLLRGQGWLCSVCLRGLTEQTAHVDHDHETGAVRAVLCFNCNGGLGQFGDDPARLRRPRPTWKETCGARSARLLGSTGCLPRRGDLVVQ